MVKSTEKGISPCAYIITNIRCGPDSGMIPIKAPKKQHPYHMLVSKGTQVPECETPVHEKESSEAPQKDTEKVFLDDVLPDMGLKVMFRAK